MTEGESKTAVQPHLQANECGECRQPLEEWEAGICEGCGSCLENS